MITSTKARGDTAPASEAPSGGVSLRTLRPFLAITFGLYALLRKVAAVDALTGLSVEVWLLSPAAAAGCSTRNRRG